MFSNFFEILLTVRVKVFFSFGMESNIGFSKIATVNIHLGFYLPVILGHAELYHVRHVGLDK